MVAIIIGNLPPAHSNIPPRSAGNVAWTAAAANSLKETTSLLRWNSSIVALELHTYNAVETLVAATALPSHQGEELTRAAQDLTDMVTTALGISTSIYTTLRQTIHTRLTPLVVIGPLANDPHVLMVRAHLAEMRSTYMVLTRSLTSICSHINDLTALLSDLEGIN